MFRTLSVSIALLVLSMPLSASAANPSSGSTSVSKINFKSVAGELFTASLSDMSRPENRASLIKAASKYCGEIERRFPTNSPSEDAWLKTETSGSADRTARAMSSPEFGRAKVKEFTANCDLYVSQYDTGQSRKHYLIGIAHTFVRFAGDAENYATTNGMDGKELGFGVLNFFAEAILKAALFETK